MTVTNTVNGFSCLCMYDRNDCSKSLHAIGFGWLGTFKRSSCYVKLMA